MGRRRGFFATVQKSIRDSERSNRRYQREALARARQADKMASANQRAVAQLVAAAQKQAEREAAEVEAEGYKAQMELLVSAHRACSPAMDWAANAKAIRPGPVFVDEAPVAAARAAIAAYKPSLIARLLKREPKQRALLAAALERAEAAVRDARAAAAAAHEEAISEWQEGLAFAARVLAEDQAAYDELVSETECLSELEELGCGVSVTWLSSRVARVSIRAQEKEVVPTEEKSVNAKGQLSTKKIPASRISEVYQDFVCGSALRAARELLAVLPLRGVVVDVWTSLLNKKSGHFEDTPILSVYCPREKLERVNVGARASS